MGNEQIGQSHLFLHVLQHIYHLGLNGYVQCGNRFVTYDKFRFYCQGAGNSHTLLLSTGKFMRIAVGMLGIQSNFAKQFFDHIGTVLFGLGQLVNINSLSDDLSYSHTRVEGCGRILENNLHLSAVRQHINCLFFSQRFAIRPQRIVIDRLSIIYDLTAGRLMKADNGTAKGRFTTSGLSYQTKGLSLFDEERNILYRLYTGSFHSLYREIFS